jgi:histidinol-phosphate/aromatic aminotransferase/cobyric acid decarboxylase-like protein
MTTRLTPSTDMMVLCNPNNPTGSVLSRAEVLQMVEDAPSNCFVLIDEAYIDFAPEESLLRDAPEIENLAVVRTFSKAYAMAGLRVGYTAMGPKIRARFDQRGRPPWPVGLLGLRAAEVALEESCYVQMRIAETLALKNNLVAQIGVPTLPSAANYFLIDLEGAKMDARELLTRLAGQRIFLRDLAGFTQRNLDRFVRITTQSAAANQRIVLALKQALES